MTQYSISFSAALLPSDPSTMQNNGQVSRGFLKDPVQLLGLVQMLPWRERVVQPDFPITATLFQTTQLLLRSTYVLRYWLIYYMWVRAYCEKYPGFGHQHPVCVPTSWNVQAGQNVFQLETCILEQGRQWDSALQQPIHMTVAVYQLHVSVRIHLRGTFVCSCNPPESVLESVPDTFVVQLEQVRQASVALLVQWRVGLYTRVESIPEIIARGHLPPFSKHNNEVCSRFETI